MTLAQLAGDAIVSAAVANGWETRRHKFARLLGHGNPAKTMLMEQRLAETREQLAGATGAGLESARATLVAQWATWLTDLLEEDPIIQPGLRALVQEIHVALPDRAASSADNAAEVPQAINRDAGRRRFADEGDPEGHDAGGPYQPGPGDELAGSGSAGHLASGGGLAVGGRPASGGAVQGRAGVTARPVQLADPPPFLAGREKLLAELDARLAGGDGPGPWTVVLYGQAGVGKTSVALEYARRHKEEVGLAWRFAAQDRAVLAAGFGQLAAELDARSAGNAWDAVASVHRVLAAFPARWLLVFDDAPDPASVQAFLPPAGDGRVLITSQDGEWPVGHALEVRVLDRGTAGGFLTDCTGDPDLQAARELAGELGGLPLALAQAAGYMRATGDSIARYLTAFRQQRQEMLDRGEPGGYRATVAATWALAFDRLEQSAPTAVGLLRLLAFCAPGTVPWRLLLQPRPGLTKGMRGQPGRVLKQLLEDPLKANDAVAALRQYSLVSPAVGGDVSVPRLAQLVTAGQMSADLARAWQQAAAAVVEGAVPEDPEQSDAWPDFAALVSHAQAALPADSPSMERIASYLGLSGNYVVGRELWQGVGEARAQALGAEHPETLATRAALADWCGEVGDAAGARDQFAALLTIRDRVNGPDHPGTLNARAHLAYWTGEAGDAAGARDRFAALLAVREVVDGPDHPDTLSARSQLARWTGEAGDAAGARDRFAALLAVREVVDGPDHPDTLSARSQLARWTGEAGDAAGARDRFAALLAVRELLDGPEHPGTLAARANLAAWTGVARNPAQTRDQYAALLAIRERAYGPDDSDTLSARSQLARWMGEAGDAAGARDQFAMLVAIRERANGTDHPETLIAYANLAYWMGEAGDAAGARHQYATLLPVLERILGPEHRDTLSVRGHLARCTGEAGDAAGARDQHAALLPDFERIYGPEHPASQSARDNLARWTKKADSSARRAHRATRL